MARIKYRLPDNIQQGVKFRVPPTHPLISIRRNWFWYIGPTRDDKHLLYSVNYVRYNFRNLLQEDVDVYSNLRVESHDLHWPNTWGPNNIVPAVNNHSCIWLTTKELHQCVFKSEPRFKGLSLFLLNHDLLPGEKKEENQHLVYTREMHEREPQF